MAYAIQAAFGAGELAPELHERTTLEKYKTGLKTLRNAVVSKTGKLVSRPGSIFYRSTKRSYTLTDKTFTADHTTEILDTTTVHNYVTGLAVQLTTTGTLPAGLALATTYYVIEGSTTSTLKLATSLDNAMMSAVKTFTDNGSGVHTIVPIDKTPKKCILYEPPYSGYIIEFGEYYVRIHNILNATYEDGAHPFTDASLPYIQFAYSNQFVYISANTGTFRPMKMVLGSLVSGDPFLSTRFLYLDGLVHFAPDGPFGQSQGIAATGAPAGYAVEYIITWVINGQECPKMYVALAGNLPVAAGQYNVITVVLTLFDHQVNFAKEVRVYRRPKDGQAYGYIGSTDTYSDAAAAPYTDRTFTFRDAGQTADFTNLPPTMQVNFDLDTRASALVRYIRGTAITVYQQRLGLSGTSDQNKEATFLSRPLYRENFYRDYPLEADSALAVKAGTSGTAKVLRYDDIGGLVAFTNQGIYSTPNGPLTPDTAYMIHRANYVIDEILPPLKVPGSVLFVEKETNSVIAIGYSDDQASFVGAEISIYSSHLLDGKRIVSWAFQDGKLSLVWCVMDDGSLIVLTWQNEQLVRAWSRADADGLFESVTSFKGTDGTKRVYFSINRDGSRSMEYLSDRHVSDIKDFICMDGTVTFKTILSSTFTASPVVHDDWEGEIRLTASASTFSNATDLGAVGTIFRIFAPDGAGCDLEVTQYVSVTEVIVQPAYDYPRDMTEFTSLYKTTNVVTGLDHLEGKDVSVMVDGFIEGSPNNLQDDHDVYTVASGQITLQNSLRGAVIHVGLPFVVDVETLDIETVEQKPTLLESILCNKVQIGLHKSRGFWVGQKFGDDDTNEGMTQFEKEEEIDGDVNVAPLALAPYTKREDIVIEGSWESKGRIAIRQVDPLPLEILSIIPDIQVEYKR